MADSASAGAQKGAEAFVTAMDILSIVSGFNGIMGPKPPTAALARADGEIIAVPEILEVDAGISVLYSKSFPEGPFGEKKEVEEKEGVYIESGKTGKKYSFKVSNQKMYQLGNHYNKHGKDMGYASKKEYEQAARIFLQKYLKDAEVFEGTYNSGHGKNAGIRQIIVRYNGKQLIINKESGQIVDFYEGTSLESFIRIERIQ